jgi:hypothetical protein
MAEQTLCPRFCCLIHGVQSIGGPALNGAFGVRQGRDKALTVGMLPRQSGLDWGVPATKGLALEAENMMPVFRSDT